MKISAKNFSTPRTSNSLAKIIAALRLKLARTPSQNTLPYKIFLYGIPYEASETYRTIRNQFENNKYLATIEVRQALYRC